MVYQRPGKKTYSYDFRCQGHRLSGDTGKTNKRDAEREENRIKKEFKDRLEASPGGARMTFGQAATKYMEQVGVHHVNRMSDLADFERLESYVGTNTLLSQIDNNLVAEVVARRRQDMRQVGKRENRNQLVTNATVNRTCTEQLRKVLIRAEQMWNVKVPKIRWTQHMLREPKERTREASSDEEARISASLSAGYDVVFEFAMLSGCRLMEIVGLTWHDVDFFTRQFTVTGKNGHSRTIPMSSRIYALLWAEKGRDPEQVFTYVARRTDKRKGTIKSERYPITYYGLQIAVRRAVVSAGVKNFSFHDARHTSATRTLRKSNLKVVQHLLGHADIATTVKYAHVTSDDLRGALEAATPTESPTGVGKRRVND